jgi:hypothetical protein
LDSGVDLNVIRLIPEAWQNDKPVSSTRMPEVKRRQHSTRQTQRPT